MDLKAYFLPVVFSVQRRERWKEKGRSLEQSRDNEVEDEVGFGVVVGFFVVVGVDEADNDDGANKLSATTLDLSFAFALGLGYGYRVWDEMVLTSHSHNIKHHSSLFCISTQYALLERKRDREGGNAELYCKAGVPFVMGTTGGDRDLLHKTVEDSKNHAVISPQMENRLKQRMRRDCII
ncbi:4-hydroxy-tetrahydrodipicolinate reductase [Vigna angularis]|uniref:4-hydroxy-tetrahydrodipicolinate reductase n=1 Tax=Phaseolus angularis TaxID=3914 RepID=A0A8T0K0E8_PHAAN|nr:4-hydroxy-tetrahydrodipicolinate reductase [Vigna angularis]